VFPVSPLSGAEHVKSADKVFAGIDDIAALAGPMGNLPLPENGLSA
jgi:hypothetical protein